MSISHYFLTAFYFLIISFGGIAPSAHMIECVVADSMPRCLHLIKKRLMLYYIIPYTKEGSMGTTQSKLLQHKICRSWYGAVIKGEVNFLFVSWPTPGETWVKQWKNKWGTEGQRQRKKGQLSQRYATR